MSRLSDLIGGILRSNTVQFNGGVMLLWLLDQVSQTEWLQSNPEYAAIAAGLVALVNMLLRFKTKKPLSQR